MDRQTLAVFAAFAGLAFTYVFVNVIFTIVSIVYDKIDEKRRGKNK